MVLLHGWGSHAARFRQFHRAAACGRLLGDRHRRAGAWRIAGAIVGFAEIPRLSRGSAAPARAGARGRRSFLGRRRGAHGARGNPPTIIRRRSACSACHRTWTTSSESFAMMLGLEDKARANLRERFAAHFGRPAKAISVAAAAPAVRIPVLMVHDEEDNVAPIAQGRRSRRRFRTRCSGVRRDWATAARCATPRPSNAWWSSWR